MNRAFSRVRKIFAKKIISSPARVTAILSVAGAVLLAAHIASYRRPGPILEKTSFLMGTVVEIKVPLADERDRSAVEASMEKAFEEARRVESLFSVYLEGSEVSKINRLKKGEELKIDGEVFRLIERSIGLYDRTYGAFDIAVKPLVDLWAKTKVSGRMPSDEDVKAATERSDCADIVLNRSAGTIAFAKDGMGLDMGAVAKGYATDMMVKALVDSGVKDAIVNCGGDMYCLGRRSTKALWKVGIRDPRDKSRIFLEFKLQDRAVDTSGDYEKFFIINGRRYSHIIDPRTGYPIGDGTVSASVIAGDSATADALATALCVLGRSGLDVVNRALGADAVIVFKDKGVLTTLMSRGFKERYDAVEVFDLR